MKIQINTDNHIACHKGLATHVKATAASSLDRFHNSITRLEIHLSDENGAKKGPSDKCCMMEARVAGRKPTAASCHAETMHHAIAGAANKLKRSLESTLKRGHHHH